MGQSYMYTKFHGVFSPYPDQCCPREVETHMKMTHGFQVILWQGCGTGLYMYNKNMHFFFTFDVDFRTFLSRNTQ